MEEENKVIAVLTEIRSELKHMNQRFDEALAHRDELRRIENEGHEKELEAYKKRLEGLEFSVKKHDTKLVAASAVVSAAIVIAGILVRLI